MSPKRDWSSKRVNYLHYVCDDGVCVHKLFKLQVVFPGTGLTAVSPKIVDVIPCFPPIYPHPPYIVDERRAETAVWVYSKVPGGFAGRTWLYY